MKLNKFWIILPVISMLMTGILLSCSDKESYVIQGEVYIEHVYSGNKLDITLDGKPLSGVTADVSVDNNETVIISLTGFLEEDSPTVWTSPMNDPAEAFIYTGKYTCKDERSIRYTVSFSDVFTPIKDMACKIVCETLE